MTTCIDVKTDDNDNGGDDVVDVDEPLPVLSQYRISYGKKCKQYSGS